MMHQNVNKGKEKWKKKKNIDEGSSKNLKNQGDSSKTCTSNNKKFKEKIDMKELVSKI